MILYPVIRDDNDGTERSELLAIYTSDSVARETVSALNWNASRAGAPERFRALVVRPNDGDKLPGQWAEGQWMEGDVQCAGWRIDDFVPLASLRLHRPEWQGWPELKVGL